MPLLSPRSKKEAVYDWLRKEIVSGRAAPGTDLIIEELAREHEVSPIPVREALQRLEAEGFVVIRPYAGVTVTAIAPHLIFEVFALLEAAEVTSGRLACHNASQADLVALEALLQQMDGWLDDAHRWSEGNIKFHQLLSQQAGTQILSALMEPMLAHWSRLRSHYLQDVFIHHLDVAQEGHWEIFDALQARDAAALERATRTHNRLARQAYIEHLLKEDLIDQATAAVLSEEPPPGSVSPRTGERAQTGH